MRDRLWKGILVGAASAIVAGSSLGCSTTATIHHRNGREIETRIMGSDREHIYFRTQAGASRVAKKNVSDIDHPGDLDILFGLLLSGYGVLNISEGRQHCRTEGTAYCVGVYSPLAVGAVLTLFGLHHYTESTGALDRKVKPDSWRELRREGAGGDLDSSR